MVGMGAWCVSFLMMLPCFVLAAGEMDKCMSESSGECRDSAELLQKRVYIDTMTTDSSMATTFSKYVPGTPGAAWTDEEALTVKAKLWYLLNLGKAGVEDIIKAWYGPGWKDGPMVYSFEKFSRMGPALLRLAFHGCVRELDGSGGCDGCLYWDGIGRVWMDYVSQHALPYGARGVPNFNNNLGPYVQILEEVYTNKSFPELAPALTVSLRDTGKSRADLWAFAGIVATEHLAFTNNMYCTRPNYEWPTPYPDSLETNSWFGKHCRWVEEQKCKVNTTSRVVFRSGRKDCVPTDLYAEKDDPFCAEGFDINTPEECEDAAKEAIFNADAPHCRSASNQKIWCHMSVQEKYKAGQGYYVNFPLIQPPDGTVVQCRGDLAIQGEDDCINASKHLFLPYGGKTAQYAGCYVLEEWQWGGSIKSKIIFGEGDPPPKYLKPPHAHTGWKTIRTICRTPAEKVAPYMAATWGKAPNSEADGAGTVKYFKEEFGLSPRETVALMGAHSVGRFHATASGFRYIWVRNGGAMLNNDYYRNLANRPQYFFTDPDCGKIGDAFGQPGKGRWMAERRGESVNGGPYMWILEQHICSKDCRNNTKDECCQDLPSGASCKPDNGRTKSMDSIQSDDDVDHGCEMFFSESGNHLQALQAEIGLYYKFQVDDNGIPSGCPGFENLFNNTVAIYSGQGGKKGEAGCPLNDLEAGDITLHEVVELYADRQDIWIEDFYKSFEKMNENGYDHTMLSTGPDVTTDVICPAQDRAALLDKSLDFGICFHKDNLSEPFVLISETDFRLLQVEPETGKLEMKRFLAMDSLSDPAKIKELPPNAQWHTAQTKEGDLLVNGLMNFGVGKVFYNASSSLLFGDHGYVTRNWPGWFPEVLFSKDLPRDKVMATWLKPVYYSTDMLSPEMPFSLFSEADHRLLQVSNQTGQLELGPVRARVQVPFPSNAAWYVDADGEHLVNGMLNLFGKLAWNRSSKRITHVGDPEKPVYLSRNWPGATPELQFWDVSVPSQQRWLKPIYFPFSLLSPPSVIISKMDNRLFQANAKTGDLEMGKEVNSTIFKDVSSIKDIPPESLWRLAKTERGQILVNGMWNFVGKLLYNISSGTIEGESGYLQRNWPGWTPEILYVKSLSTQSWMEDYQTWLEPSGVWKSEAERQPCPK